VTVYIQTYTPVAGQRPRNKRPFLSNGSVNNSHGLVIAVTIEERLEAVLAARFELIFYEERRVMKSSSARVEVG
jgi:hypothetical protein